MGIGFLLAPALIAMMNSFLLHCVAAVWYGDTLTLLMNKVNG